MVLKSLGQQLSLGDFCTRYKYVICLNLLIYLQYLSKLSIKLDWKTLENYYDLGQQLSSGMPLAVSTQSFNVKESFLDSVKL